MKKEEVERAILTTYRKEIFRPFTKAINDYNLIQDDDHICVCISGGKDSFLLAKCMQELEKHGKSKIKCEYVVMDPGYDKDNINQIRKNADDLGININIVSTNIFESVKSSGHKAPCFICARMRRGHLYSIAKDLGCNKIALGHHFDDVIETTLLSMFYNGIYNTMLPKIDSENFEKMQLIRPLYLVREDTIIRFMNKFEMSFSDCNCPMKKDDSKRKEMKEFIKKVSVNNPVFAQNIFKSADNVELDFIRGYIKDKKRYNSFDKK